MFTAFVRRTVTLRAAYVPLAAAYTPASTFNASAVPMAMTSATSTPTGCNPVVESASKFPATTTAVSGSGGSGDTLPLVGDPRVSIWRDEETLLRASLGRLEAERELARMRHRCEDELRSLREGLKVREGQVARLVRRVITCTPVTKRRGGHSAAGSSSGNSPHGTAVASGAGGSIAATDECEGPGAVVTQDQAAAENCSLAHQDRLSGKGMDHSMTLEDAGKTSGEEINSGGNDEDEKPEDDQQSPGSPIATGEDAAEDADADKLVPPPPLGTEPHTSKGAGGAAQVGGSAAVTNPTGEVQPAAPTDAGLAKDAEQSRKRRAGTTKSSSGGSSSSSGKKRTTPKGRGPAKNKKADTKKPAKPRTNTQRRSASHNTRASKKKAQPTPKKTTPRSGAAKRPSSASNKQPRQRKQQNKTNKSKQGNRGKSSEHTNKPTSTRRRK
ncbi:hypothetical protein TraAM80_08083 [Trypanosoma rangeli]|uniref:Uncharacterized protein n=1 Tax=Trypanosoma rangeli TaxID=5698 RepID=A0A3R7KFX7_TRYRA|nr:uncharacterized protein TraAM80_08083 [Trypanosoma rangeli]RNE99653.1 hypothetical protein TraAM80_08083 [Trypanosoma rangeli]|eukprot:RNE99653.1 hypothetical protein TraAM80_08083 [Trypanosoma rangeli]